MNNMVDSFRRKLKQKYCPMEAFLCKDSQKHKCRFAQRHREGILHWSCKSTHVMPSTLETCHSTPRPPADLCRKCHTDDSVPEPLVTMRSCKILERIFKPIFTRV